MSIVARIRPSVNVKPARVTKPLAVPFGAGLVRAVATVEPAPTVKTIPELLAGGLASRRPRLDGYGLSDVEYTRLNGVRNEARYSAENTTRPGKPLTSRQVHEAIEKTARIEFRAILADRTDRRAEARQQANNAPWVPRSPRLLRPLGRGIAGSRSHVRRSRASRA